METHYKAHTLFESLLYAAYSMALFPTADPPIYNIWKQQEKATGGEASAGVKLVVARV